MNQRVAIAAGLLLTVAGTGPAATAGQTATSVVIDGALAPLARMPVRVGNGFYVPARALFEAFGATVRAHADKITVITSAAGAPAHTSVLYVGGTTATFDGDDRPLPGRLMLIDGTAYVPLRLAATVVRANVRYDPAARTIFFTRSILPTTAPTAVPTQRVTDAPPPPSPVPEPVVTAEPTPTPIQLPTAAIVLRLVREEPARETAVERSRPEISASFGEPVASATVRILLDGREITGDATITNRYFIYEPTQDLTPGSHVVMVAGRTPLHEAFADQWSFVSGEAKSRNYLSGVEPPSGIAVTSPLVISGITRPRARIGMVATSSETAAHFSELSGGSFTDHTSADAHGNFEIRLDLVDTGSGFLDVRLDSTAPDGAVAVKTLRLRL